MPNLQLNYNISEWVNDLKSVCLSARTKKKTREKRKKERSSHPLRTAIKVWAVAVSCQGLTAIPTAAIKYALEEKNLVLVYDSNLLFFFFPRSAGSNQAGSEALFFFFSTTHPLLIFKYFGDQAVRSIAEETLFKTILTQTWAYAQVAEAKNLTKTRLASHHHHHRSKEPVENMIGLTLQLESVGSCYCGGKVSAIRSPDGYKGMSPASCAVSRRTYWYFWIARRSRYGCHNAEPSVWLAAEVTTIPRASRFHHQHQHQYTSFPNSPKSNIFLSPKKEKKRDENSTYKPHKSSTDKQQSAQSSESDSHSSQIDTNPPATTSPLRRFPTRKSLHKSPPRAASLLKVRPVGSRERSRVRPCCWSGGRTRSKVRKRSAWSRRRIPWRVDAFFRGGATWLLGLFTEEKNIKISLPQWQKKKKKK